jgi:NhaP-type Na+/H+ or K+/H+ antiporter
MPSSSSSPVTQISSPGGQNQDEAPQRIPTWLQQAERFLRVIVRLYLGLLVCCAPWYPAAWDNNPLFASSPWLVAFITHGAVRGVVSGLGILNLWIAVREALRSPSQPGRK